MQLTPSSPAQLVEEPPVRPRLDQLLRTGLDDSTFVQSKCMEPDSVFRIGVSPAAIGQFANNFQGHLLAGRVSLVDHEARPALGIGCTDIRGFQESTHGALRQASALGAASLLSVPGTSKAEPPPEVKKIRLMHFPAICLAPGAWLSGERIVA